MKKYHQIETGISQFTVGDKLASLPDGSPILCTVITRDAGMFKVRACVMSAGIDFVWAEVFEKNVIEAYPIMSNYLLIMINGGVGTSVVGIKDDGEVGDYEVIAEHREQQRYTLQHKATMEQIDLNELVEIGFRKGETEDGIQS